MNKELQTVNYSVFALTTVGAATIIMVFVQEHFVFYLKKTPINR
jgi:hypothetical protein